MAIAEMRIGASFGIGAMVSQTVESVWLLGRVAGIHIAHVWEEKMRFAIELLRSGSTGRKHRQCIGVFSQLSMVWFSFSNIFTGRCSKGNDNTSISHGRSRCSKLQSWRRNHSLQGSDDNPLRGSHKLFTAEPSEDGEQRNFRYLLIAEIHQQRDVATGEFSQRSHRAHDRSPEDQPRIATRYDKLARCRESH
jgi:hypothetical protein